MSNNDPAKLDHFVHKSKTNGVDYIDFNEVFAKGNKATKNAASKLLEKIHAGIYCKTFPLKNEQEAVEDWLS